MAESATQQVTLSRKKYVDMSAAVHETLKDDEQAERVLEAIQHALGWNPDAKQYTPELGRKQYVQRKAVALQHGYTDLRKFKQALATGEVTLAPDVRIRRTRASPGE